MTAATTQVLVVGGGIAGVSAALAARARGASVCLLDGPGGATALTSGAWDVASDLDAPPESHASPRRTIREHVERLAREVPAHPYARLGASLHEQLTRSHALVHEALSGYAPIAWDGHGVLVATDIGLVRRAATVQDTVLPLDGMQRVLVGVLVGYRTIDMKFVTASLTELFAETRTFIALHAAPLDFFKRRDDALLLPHELAEIVDSKDGRDRLVASLRHALASGGPYDAVLLPPMLGLHDDSVSETIRAELGVKLGEVTQSLAGPQSLRLVRRATAALERAGVKRIARRAVGISLGDDLVNVVLDDGERLTARAVVLATGKFVGGGVVMEHADPREPLADLPISRDGKLLPLVSSMEGRDPAQLFGASPAAPGSGFRSGVSYDEALRARGRNGQVLSPRLFVAGSMLEGTSLHDGSGLGVATVTGFVAGEGAALVP